MTVDELRRALEGVPGDMPVAIQGEFITEPDEAYPRHIKLGEPVCGIGWEHEASEADPLYFLID